MTVSLETVSSTHNTPQGPRAPPTSGGVPDALMLPEQLVDELANILADALVADLQAFPKS